MALSHSIGFVVVMLVHILQPATGETCPDMCKCSHNLRTVSCIGKKLSSIPQNIPSNVTELYLSNNFLIKIPAYSFKNLTYLKELSLKDNLLTTIEDHAFSGLLNLKRLYLTNNVLSNLTKLAFEGLDKVEKLYLAQNRLKTVPDLTMTGAISEISLDYNLIENKLPPLFPVGYKQLKNVKGINLAHNNIGNLNFSDFKNIGSSIISKIDLSWCRLTNVGNTTFSLFPKLQSLVLSYNGLLTVTAIQNIVASLENSTISSLDISNSTNTSPTLPVSIFDPLNGIPLRTLDMSHAGIRVLRNSTFAPISKLYILDLSYSLFEVAELGTFQPLKSLKRLNLNNCKMQQIRQLPPAIVIDISHNPSIKAIQKGAFDLAMTTENLTLSYCSIQTLEEHALDGLINLKMLDLSHNMLAQLTSFKSMASLNILNLSHNRLLTITSVHIFEGLLSLYSLDLSNNGMEQIPLNAFNQLSKLEILDLQHNNLKTCIEGDKNGSLFKSLINLRHLYLNDNSLLDIGNDTFSGLVNVTKLVLAYNHIKYWNYFAFSKTVNIQELDLSYNKISLLDSNSIHFFRAGIQLNLTGNFFNCWCDLVWFRNWFNTTDLIFVDNKTYICGSPNEMQGKLFIDFNTEVIKSKCKPPLWLYFTYGGVGAFILLLIIVIIIYRNRWRILLSFYRCKRSCRVSKNNGDPLFNEYNATISYGPDDESKNWVHHQFITKLEEWNCKNVFSEEDVMLGTGYSEQIGKMQEAMSHSRYIILVLNKAYIKDGRRLLELDLALQSAVEDSREGVAKIIPVLFNTENIKTSTSIRDKLRRWMNKQNGDILIWNDDDESCQGCFWEKIKEIFENSLSDEQKY